MNVNVHIERLILEGLPVERRQGPELQAAIEAELSRLLAEGGLSAGLASGGTLTRLSGGVLPLTPSVLPAPLGEGIARTVYDSIGEGGRGETT
jgi:hypothetical protein